MSKIIKQKKDSGFVLLFAITLGAILLALALGVTEIAFKEIKFSTSARDANDAFFAADMGIESALFQDKAGTICSPAPCSFEFTLIGLGNAALSCAKVNVSKTTSPSLTTVVSKGYNVGNATCSSINPDRIERELKVNYSTE